MVVDYQYPNDVSFPNEGLYKVEQVDDVFNVGEALKRDVCVCSDQLYGLISKRRFSSKMKMRIVIKNGKKELV